MPTQKRESYRHSFKSNKCAKCSTSIEDENHILKCRIKSRKTLQRQWIGEVSSYLSGSTTPIFVQDAIVEQLTIWLEPPLLCTIPVYDPHNFLDNALSMQQQIGCNNFVRGRLAIEWGRLINRHYIQNSTATSDSESFSAETWASLLIAISFKYILLLWEQRNNEEHGVTANKLEIKKKEKLIEEVRHIKTLALKWLDTDQKYVSDTIQDLENKNSHQLEV
jgi:hypothetical protein